MCRSPQHTVIRVALLFPQCHVPHRDLHSFPTRRSSDLAAERGDQRRQTGVHDDPEPSLSLRETQQTVDRWIGQYKRSEEHTSELQSRQYLVCRLLLEKKNKSTYSQQTSYPSCLNVQYMY